MPPRRHAGVDPGAARHQSRPASWAAASAAPIRRSGPRGFDSIARGHYGVPAPASTSVTGNGVRGSRSPASPPPSSPRRADPAGRRRRTPSTPITVNTPAPIPTNRRFMATSSDDAARGRRRCDRTALVTNLDTYAGPSTPTPTAATNLDTHAGPTRASAVGSEHQPAMPADRLNVRQQRYLIEDHS